MSHLEDFQCLLSEDFLLQCSYSGDSIKIPRSYSVSFCGSCYSACILKFLYSAST